jgi:hypothetical protein
MKRSNMHDREVLSHERLTYNTPHLTIHGDVETITLGDQLGEQLDAAFTMSAAPSKGNKKPKKSKTFS